MQCDRAKELVGSYIDGELTGADRQAVAEHLQTCVECARLAQDFGRMGRQIAAAGREPAPKALALRIRAALKEEEATALRQEQPRLEKSLPARLWNVRSGMARMAAALLAACVLSSALTWGTLTLSGTTARLESEIVTAHIRSLLQDSPIQVASSDEHTVKPWFAGRVDFAPDVKDLTAEGFPLAGGRLDYIGGRRVGALVYKRRMHVVNVFMWPAASGEIQAPRIEVVKGYNLLSWSRAGVVYWAISDLNAGELRQLQTLM